MATLAHAATCKAVDKDLNDESRFRPSTATFYRLGRTFHAEEVANA